MNSSFQVIGSTKLVAATSFPSAVGQGHIHMRTGLERRDLQIDSHAPAVGIRLGAQFEDVRLLGSGARCKIVGEEEIHGHSSKRKVASA